MRLRLRLRRRRMPETATMPASTRDEAEVSRQRQRKTRKEVIEPLRELAERNRFADLIRASLAEGHRRR